MWLLFYCNSNCIKLQNFGVNALKWYANQIFTRTGLEFRICVSHSKCTLYFYICTHIKERFFLYIYMHIHTAFTKTIILFVSFLCNFCVGMTKEKFLFFVVIRVSQGSCVEFFLSFTKKPIAL